MLKNKNIVQFAKSFALVQRGFTLVELAISLIVLGVLIAGSFAAFFTWQQTQTVKKTQENIDSIALVIGAFRSANARYPCPSPLNVARNSPNYGFEPVGAGGNGCVDGAVAGTCPGGVCVVASRRTVDERPFNPITAPNGIGDVNNDGIFNPALPLTVRIGAIPFRSLNISEEMAYDAYGNRLMYVVTEELAQPFPYNPQAGGIAVEYQNSLGVRQSHFTPADSAHFIVFSTGENRAGGYTRSGVAYATGCNLLSFDGENCDAATLNPASADSVFYIADASSAAGANRNDDVLMYQVPLNSPLWAQSPGNPTDIYTIRGNNPGSGTVSGDWRYEWFTRNSPQTISDYPNYAVNNPNFINNALFWIGGNLRIQGDAQADLYCDQGGANCFPTAMIASAAGVSCPNPNDLAIGIQNANVLCTNGVLTIECPGNQIVQAMDNGELVCSNMPCVNQTGTNDCTGQSFPIPDLEDGETFSITLNSPHCYTQTYECDNGTLSGGGGGICDCPSQPTTRTITCAPNCENSTATQSRDVDCDECNIGSWTDDSPGCGFCGVVICDPQTDPNCPGFCDENPTHPICTNPCDPQTDPTCPGYCDLNPTDPNCSSQCDPHTDPDCPGFCDIPANQNHPNCEEDDCAINPFGPGCPCDAPNQAFCDGGGPGIPPCPGGDWQPPVWVGCP